MYIKRVILFSVVLVGVSYGIFQAIRVPSKNVSIPGQTEATTIETSEATISAQPTPVSLTAASPTPTASASAVSKKTLDKTKLYPDSNLTPGATTDINLDVLCLASYENKTANISEATVKKVYQRYNLNYDTDSNDYKVDALIPVNLGGSSDITNLWPQPIAVPGYHEKNAAEKYIRKQVCNGGLTLTKAQQQIREDWYAVYNKMR